MKFRLVVTSAAAAIVVMCAPSAMAMRPCPPDVNCNGAVNMDDLLDVVNNWGKTGQNVADMNESGAVDIDDLLGVVNSWGPCLFEYGQSYPNAEAHQIGLEMLGPNGPLALSQPIYQRVVRDLNLIRTAVPGLAPQPHATAWMPNQLIVGLPIGSANAEFECLNVFYHVTERQLMFTLGEVQYWLLTFAGKVNVPALANVYRLVGGVISAEPNAIVAGQNHYRATDVGDGAWKWEVADGFGNCQGGCVDHHMYLIQTSTDGTLNLLVTTPQQQPANDADATTELASAGGVAPVSVRSPAR